MTSKLGTILTSGIILLAVAFFATHQGHKPEAIRWQIVGDVGADSLSRVLAARIGAPPDTLSSCGSRRIRLVYVDAPIDLSLRVRTKRASNGVVTVMDGRDMYARNHVAHTIASVAWFDGARNDAVDTVTVKLVRRNKNDRFGESTMEWSDYNFIRDPRGGMELVRIEPTPHPCAGASEAVSRIRAFTWAVPVH